MEKQSVTNDVSYLFATLYSICYLAFFILRIIPTRLSFISENQSVDHHSRPFRGRMKGTFILSAKVIKIIHCRISTPAQYSIF